MSSNAAVRPEVQALRAGAVLLVVLFHLWPGRVPGGYVGVDVFFVISGFLITAHLVREVEATGRVSLTRFWARRARRLLPAAYLVLATTTLATYVWSPRALWPKDLGEVVASALYVENWLLAADAVDYLAADQAPSAAQHYWSLSVEEQFYLVWPVLVLLAALAAARLGARRRLPMLAGVLGVVTVASFCYSLVLTSANPATAYFVTPGRAWQFGVGALLALGVSRPRDSRHRAMGSSAASLLSWTGLVAIVTSGLAYSASTPFPGVAAVLPVLGTTAVIAAGTPGEVFARWTQARPVQLLGDISYSTYLWHWPAIVVLPAATGHPLRQHERLAILTLTLVAAWLTKRYVEDPIRFGHRLGIRRTGVTFALTGVAAAVLTTVGLTGVGIAAHASERADELTKELNARMPECFGAAAMDTVEPCDDSALAGLLVPAPEAVEQDYPDYPGCWAFRERSELLDCTFGDPDDDSAMRILVIGDSHARSLLPAFKRLAEEELAEEEEGVVVVAQVKGSCPWTDLPLETKDELHERTCNAWRTNLARWLEEHAHEFDVVVTTALADDKGTLDERVDGFSSAWSVVTDQGVPVVVIRDNPHFPEDPNHCLAALETIEPDSCAVPRSAAMTQEDALTQAAEITPGAIPVDLTDYYCHQDTCPAVIGGVNVYRDDEHLTATFARTLAPYLFRALPSGPSR